MRDRIQPMPQPVKAPVFSLDVDLTGKVPVVHCHGRLVAGVNDILYHGVRPLLPDHRRVVLDLTDVTHMDSMGLGALVRLYVAGRSTGCELHLRNLGKRIRELLGMTNLLSAFTVLGENNVIIP